MREREGGGREGEREGEGGREREGEREGERGREGGREGERGREREGERGGRETDKERPTKKLSSTKRHHKGFKHIPSSHHKQCHSKNPMTT